MRAASKMQFKSVNYTGMAPGPKLIVMGATHGNEKCGTQAIQRIMADIDGGSLHVSRGSVTFVPT
jgi:predicted deacylase